MMRNAVLLGFVLFLVSCGQSRLTYSTGSNVKEDLSVEVEELAIVAVGDEDLVEDLYMDMLPLVEEGLESRGINVQGTAVATYGDSESFGELSVKMTLLRPEFVLEIRPYITFRGHVQIKTIDVRLIKTSNSDVLWRGYVDITMTGSKDLEDAVIGVGDNLIKMLEDANIIQFMP